ncbi:FixH family protein [Ignavibacterium album JCM 16511]|uniref:FixH family protein n=1 Tax=Ignavibacterium album (strain DSM 19864 / JCM 16511 / NBRC 101810 / Mat9-16) TaxID=945713 RepID=I0AHI0_IGNAJ|nr:FixH family protein [Ignavibacterium album]AFH48437.1 FixH family protein [Ignavibacterium album JCM 16511]
MKKISWGTGIVIAIIIFVVLVLAQTIYLMNQKVDLVEEDYYKKGIEYQKDIDVQKKTNELSEKVNIDFNDQYLIISFPKNLSDNKLSGEILLYRPSDSGLDMKIPLSTDSLSQVIPVSGLKKGFWRVKLRWQYEGQNYYDESSFRVE